MPTRVLIHHMGISFAMLSAILISSCQDQVILIKPSPVGIYVKHGDKYAKLTSIHVVNPIDRPAANDAVEIILRMTGEELKIVQEPVGIHNGALVIGGNGASGPIGLESGYAVTLSEGSVSVCGANPYYTKEGVYKIFERLGAGFYARGKNAEHEMRPGMQFYPDAKAYYLESGWIDKPRFKWLTTDWDIANPETSKDSKLFRGIFWYHTADLLVPFGKHGKSNPDYYALSNNGTRLNADHPDKWKSMTIHLCLSNPEVQRIAAENILAWMESEPNKKYFNASPGDGPGWCNCEKCKSMGTPADRLMQFVNNIAARARLSHPEKKIVYLAYTPNTEGPPAAIRPLDNVVILFAPYCWGGARSQFHPLNTPVNDVAHRNFRRWTEILSPDQMIGFEYPKIYPYPIYPNGALPAAIENIRLYAANPQVKSIIYCGLSPDFSFSDLHKFVISQLLWDPSLDENILIDAFMCNYYGQAESFMKAYYVLLSQTIQETPHFQRCEYYAPGLLENGFAEKSYPLLNSAASVVSSDTNRLLRVNMEKMCLLFADIHERNPANGRQPDLEVFAPKLQDFHNLVITQINPFLVANKRKPLSKFANRPGHDARTWTFNVSGFDMGENEFDKSDLLNDFINSHTPSSFLYRNSTPEKADPFGEDLAFSGKTNVQTIVSDGKKLDFALLEYNQAATFNDVWIENPYDAILQLNLNTKATDVLDLAIMANGTMAFSGKKSSKINEWHIYSYALTKASLKHGFNHIEIINMSSSGLLLASNTKLLF